MPLNIPDTLPAIDILKKENIFVIDKDRAASQDIRPMKIVCLNLMPLKIATETDVVRLLSNTPLQIELDFMKLGSHISKNTSQEHMREFYVDFADIRKSKYDGLIITGAPVEQLDFEDVNYWDELTEVMDWARSNVTSTIFICWAAQAAMYYYYGVPKYQLPKKRFGVFEHKTLDPLNPLFRGFDDVFFMPHSRHTEIKAEDVEKVPGLDIVATSEEAGPAILMARNGREIFITGHIEYAPDTLDREYKRDLLKDLPIDIPKNYYPNDDYRQKPVVRWRSHANLLYSNWLNYFVYQETPYDLSSIM